VSRQQDKDRAGSSDDRRGLGQVSMGHRERSLRAALRAVPWVRRDRKPRVIGAWGRVLVLAPHTDDGEFGCCISRTVEREGGNREVSPLFFSVACGDLSGACDGASFHEEGGPWGKHGFPHANETSSVGRTP
jgi:hypothetical protein